MLGFVVQLLLSYYKRTFNGQLTESDVTVGTTVTYAFGTDTSHEVPNLDTGFGDAGGFKAFLDLAVHGLSLIPGKSAKAKKASDIFSSVSSEIGQIGSSHETGISDLNERQMTVSPTATGSLSTFTLDTVPGCTR